jgi:hypothetical protein
MGYFIVQQQQFFYTASAVKRKTYNASLVRGRHGFGSAYASFGRELSVFLSSSSGVFLALFLSYQKSAELVLGT